MATILSAGFPKNLGAARDYEAAFTVLDAANIRGFFPCDTYQLTPSFLGLGWLEDFIPPKVYELTNEAVAAMKAHGIKLIVNGGLFYPVGQAYPSIANDPLKRLIQAHGSDFLYGIWGHDEPTHSGVAVSESQKLHDRRNAILPGLPILMCHAPMKNEAAWNTATKRVAYLNSCIAHSAYANTILFDIYPFPPASANLLTPAGGATVATTWQTAVGGYKSWLAANFPTKQRGIILQAHQLADFYSDEAIASMGITRAQAEAAYPGPTAAEYAAMKAFMSDADVFGWYGPSFQPNEAAPDWLNILSA